MPRTPPFPILPLGLALAVGLLSLLTVGLGALALAGAGLPWIGALGAVALLGFALTFGASLLALDRLRRWAVAVAGGSPQDTARRELLLDLVDVGSFEADPRSGTVSLSSGSARLLGLGPTPREGPWDRAFAAVRRDDLADLEAALATPGEPGASRRVTWRIRVPEIDGSARTLEVQARVLLDDQGRPEWILGLVRDVSSREALDQARAAWTSALEAQVAVRTAEAERRARQAGELAMELTRSEHRARQRLARVLHDGLQQTLVAVRFRLRRLALHSHDAERDELDALLQQAIDEARTLAAELDPPVDPDQDLAGALDWLSDRLHRRHGLSVQVRGVPRSGPLPAQHGVVLFQAARELLFNVVKHARVDTARVEVATHEGQLRLVVRDEGVGVSAEGESGIGLAHAARRLESLGGGLEVAGNPGRGTAVTAWLPAHPGSPEREDGGGTDPSRVGESTHQARPG